MGYKIIWFPCWLSCLCPVFEILLERKKLWDKLWSFVDVKRLAFFGCFNQWESISHALIESNCEYLNVPKVCLSWLWSLLSPCARVLLTWWDGKCWNFWNQMVWGFCYYYGFGFVWFCFQNFCFLFSQTRNILI